MGFRFRNSIKIAPGVRLNVSKSGTSWTLGRRGASVNVGGDHPRATIGVPGTGISYRENLDQAASGEAQEPRSSSGRTWWGVGALLVVILLLIGSTL